jgi:hypothetical protein
VAHYVYELVRVWREPQTPCSEMRRRERRGGACPRPLRSPSGPHPGGDKPHPYGSFLLGCRSSRSGPLRTGTSTPRSPPPSPADRR